MTDLHPDTGESRPAGCCGVCPPVAGGGYDCTCKDNARCPVWAAAVERAEALVLSVLEDDEHAEGIDGFDLACLIVDALANAGLLTAADE